MACLFCAGNAFKYAAVAGMAETFQCDNCGRYSVSLLSEPLLPTDQSTRLKFASWIYGQNLLGAAPVIDKAAIALISALPMPGVEKRAELYLGAVIRRLDGNLMGRFSLADPMIKIASWCLKDNDSIALANYLKELGAFEDPTTNIGQEMLLLARGHYVYEKMAGHRALSSQAFVAMRFSDELKPVFDDGIAVGIRGAGYVPYRVDRDDDDGKIDDLIVAEIRRSAFLVADFTEHRGGVYYEAGFAHGLGRRVIFTCRRDHIGELHFDVRQYNTIPWETPADLIKPLQNRILAIFGAGPLAPGAKPLS